MSTISEQRSLDQLFGRLAVLTPQTLRRWGTLTPAEMLCHLGDAGDVVLGHRALSGPAPSPVRRPVFKWLALRSPIPWPKGVATRPGVDPRKEGTRPGDFERDRTRVITGLKELATAPRERLPAAHSRFGLMTREDWHRWAYRHVDHHLRQFGL